MTRGDPHPDRLARPRGRARAAVAHALAQRGHRAGGAAGRHGDDVPARGELGGARYYQSLIIEDIDAVVDAGPPSRLAKEIERAHAYNDALTGGAIVSPDSNIPQGEGTLDAEYDYLSCSTRAAA